MKWIFLGLIRLLDYLRVKAEHFSISCAQAVFALDKKIKPQFFREALDAATEDLEAFISQPRELANTVVQDGEKHKEAAFYYFLLKQLSSLWECESKALPLQVFNEMRNALDHFYRSLIILSGERQEADQLKKMKDHLQRAILDVAKILCAHYSDTIAKRTREIGEKTLGFVDSGEFIKNLTRRQHDAHHAYMVARRSDAKICPNHENQDVMLDYLKAVIAHKEMYDYYAKHTPQIRWAQFAKWRYISGTAAATIVIALALEVFGGLFSDYASPFAKDLVTGIFSNLSAYADNNQ